MAVLISWSFDQDALAAGLLCCCMDARLLVLAGKWCWPAGQKAEWCSLSLSLLESAPLRGVAKWVGLAVSAVGLLLPQEAVRLLRG